MAAERARESAVLVQSRPIEQKLYFIHGFPVDAKGNNLTCSDRFASQSTFLQKRQPPCPRQGVYTLPDETGTSEHGKTDTVPQTSHWMEGATSRPIA
jgi:hypothetical protein